MSKSDLLERLHYRHEYGVDFDLSEIDLFGYKDYVVSTNPQEPDGLEEPGVEWAMASQFIKSLRVLGEKNRSSQKPILIHLKTCGGDWHEGMAIYNAIRFCPVPTVIINHTHARSMSSLIFQAADRRVMMPESVYMMHWGEEAQSGEKRTFASTFRFYHDKYDCDEKMLEIYSKGIARVHHSRPRSTIKSQLRKEIESKGDFYLTDVETVNAGLADYVFDGDWDKLKRNVKKVSPKKK